MRPEPVEIGEIISMARGNGIIKGVCVAQRMSISCCRRRDSASHNLMALHAHTTDGVRYGMKPCDQGSLNFMLAALFFVRNLPTSIMKRLQWRLLY